MISYRVRAAANFKNVVLRKTHLKIKVGGGVETPNEK